MSSRGIECEERWRRTEEGGLLRMSKDEGIEGRVSPPRNSPRRACSQNAQVAATSQATAFGSVDERAS